MALKLPGPSWSVVKVKVNCLGWDPDSWLYMVSLTDAFGDEHRIGTTGVRFHDGKNYLNMLLEKFTGDRVLVTFEASYKNLSTTARQIWINRSQVL